MKWVLQKKFMLLLMIFGIFSYTSTSFYGEVNMIMFV